MLLRAHLYTVKIPHVCRLFCFNGIFYFFNTFILCRTTDFVQIFRMSFCKNIRMSTLSVFIDIFVVITLWIFCKKTLLFVFVSNIRFCYCFTRCHIFCPDTARLWMFSFCFRIWTVHLCCLTIALYFDVCVWMPVCVCDRERGVLVVMVYNCVWLNFDLSSTVCCTRLIRYQNHKVQRFASFVR